MTYHIIHRTKPFIEISCSINRIVFGIGVARAKRADKDGDELCFALQFIHWSVFISWNATL